MITSNFPPSGVQQYELPDVKMLSDHSYHPYWFFRTYGKLDYDTMRLVYQVRDPISLWAAAHNTKVYAVWDFSETSPPDAINRKQIASLGEEADNLEGYIKVVMLVKNPLLRGVVTAVKWMMGDKVPVELASDVRAAVELGRREYEKADLACPSVPASYELPAWDDSRKTHRMKVSDIVWSLNNRGRDAVNNALATSRR
jgi:hypothetical protein